MGGGRTDGCPCRPFSASGAVLLPLSNACPPLSATRGLPGLSAFLGAFVPWFPPPQAVSPRPAACGSARLRSPRGCLHVALGLRFGEAIPRFLRAKRGGACLCPCLCGVLLLWCALKLRFVLQNVIRLPFIRDSCLLGFDGAHHHKSVFAASKQVFGFCFGLLVFFFICGHCSEYVDVFFFPVNALPCLRNKST